MSYLHYDVADYGVLARDWFLAGRDHAGIIVGTDRTSLGDIVARLAVLFDRYPHGAANLYLRLP